MRDNLIGLISRDRLDGGGRCDPKKGSCMMSLIHDENLKECIEIGVWRGSSLMYIIEGAMKIGGHVTAIDPYNYENIWNEFPDEGVLAAIRDLIPNQATLDKVHDDLIYTINNNSLEKYVDVIRDCSKNAYGRFIDESVDFIHIDGNHDYLNVSSDINLYLPKIKCGGIIVMDDTHWEGVEAAIKEHLMPYVEVIFLGEGWAVYRKK